ncbi:hypothetical protein BU14_0504s0001 [Porphyra umbilicalis]|uniref:Uncharacterized protein n=1 Tax=Porphyra umbilicalis TaxID=2786 RepID=A0A1X6NT27_PORUM|nr:hypothetical protein BU14_0504s0001 [Porphyra umbilicalis]|eukprot:OSX71748.1 hypothetical protein BU14_0504s0001 [Porphyra umbilicalis]
MATERGLGWTGGGAASAPPSSPPPRVPPVDADDAARDGRRAPCGRRPRASARGSPPRAPPAARSAAGCEGRRAAAARAPPAPHARPTGALSLGHGVRGGSRARIGPRQSAQRLRGRKPAQAEPSTGRPGGCSDGPHTRASPEEPAAGCSSTTGGVTDSLISRDCRATPHGVGTAGTCRPQGRRRRRQWRPPAARRCAGAAWRRSRGVAGVANAAAARVAARGGDPNRRRRPAPRIRRPRPASTASHGPGHPPLTVSPVAARVVVPRVARSRFIRPPRGPPRYRRAEPPPHFRAAEAGEPLPRRRPRNGGGGGERGGRLGREGLPRRRARRNGRERRLQPRIRVGLAHGEAAEGGGDAAAAAAADAAAAVGATPAAVTAAAAATAGGRRGNSSGRTGRSPRHASTAGGGAPRMAPPNGVADDAHEAAAAALPASATPRPPGCGTPRAPSGGRLRRRRWWRASAMPAATPASSSRGAPTPRQMARASGGKGWSTPSVAWRSVSGGSGGMVGGGAGVGVWEEQHRSTVAVGENRVRREQWKERGEGVVVRRRPPAPDPTPRGRSGARRRRHAPPACRPNRGDASPSRGLDTDGGPALPRSTRGGGGSTPP